MTIDAEKELRKCRDSFEYWTRYVNVLGDPKHPGGRVVWKTPQLRHAFGAISAIVMGQHYKIDGPRDSGCTTTAVLVAVWRWLFSQGSSMLFVVPTPRHVDRIAAHFRHIMHHLPHWMMTNANILRDYCLENVAGGSDITLVSGDSVENFGRGSRHDAVFVDYPESFPRREYVMAAALSCTHSVITIESSEDFSQSDPRPVDLSPRRCASCGNDVSPLKNVSVSPWSSGVISEGPLTIMICEACANEHDKWCKEFFRYA